MSEFLVTPNNPYSHLVYGIWMDEKNTLRATCECGGLLLTLHAALEEWSIICNEDFCRRTYSRSPKRYSTGSPIGTYLSVGTTAGVYPSVRVREWVLFWTGLPMSETEVRVEWVS